MKNKKCTSPNSVYAPCVTLKLMFYKEKRDEELRKEALELGLSSEGWYTADGVFREAAVQARVRDAKRSKREGRLWLIAVISALASLFSALAAWYTVLQHGA